MMVPTGPLCPGPAPVQGSLQPVSAGYASDIGPLAAKEAREVAVRVLTGLIKLYQLTLSPFIGRQCRFHPTCSHYALEVIDQHGPIAGCWLALRRLLKCHPFHPGGLDLPPPRGG